MSLALTPPGAMTTRIAIVLLNLGGPDSLASVEGFLRNLFSDPDIFRLPLPSLTQRPFAFFVARRRRREATAGYAAIGGCSPLLANTELQARALRAALPSGFEVFVCMRYWHPLTEEVVVRLRDEGYRRVVLLPLYPQYSGTTSGSSRNEFMRQCQRLGYEPEVEFVPHWYDDEGYQQAIAEGISAQLSQFSVPDPAQVTLLFSAHGLPERVVAAGDPYADQVRATCEGVRARLGWPRVRLCFQSRVGPLPWLRPYTDDVIREEAAAGTKQILVYPVAFVSDHVETLFELGITYRDLAHTLGVREYRVAPALNDDPQLIEVLKRLSLEYAHGTGRP
ncbi:MAG: ferrochelatase [Acidiferrobacteraceae bacterium]